VDNTVAQRYVMSVMIDTSKAAARDIKTLKQVVVRQSKLYRVGSTSDNGSEAINTNATDRDFVYRRSWSGEDQISGISCISINLRNVAW
jgi:hypothetical protein